MKLSSKIKHIKQKKNKNIIKTIKKQIGGAAAVAPVINHQIHSFKEFIAKDSITAVLIKFKGIKFYCNLGENKLLIGNPPCIELIYNFDILKCHIESFFYSSDKLSCEKDKFINTTNFKDMSNNGINTPNKKFNKTVLELIDIININMGILVCTLDDTSFIKSTKCVIISISKLKHIERGYGFYNEFGFIYIGDSKILYEKLPDDSYDALIEYSNTFLSKNIPEIQQTLFVHFKNENAFLRQNPGNINSIISKYPAILELTLSEIVIGILNYCKDNKPIFQDQLTHEDLMVLKDLISFAFMKFKIAKLYEYNYENAKVSTLLYKNLPSRHFAMVDFPKYKINITDIKDPELNERIIQKIVEITL
jgi:hypothetical protein